MQVKEVDIGLAADLGTLSRLPKLGLSYSWVKDVSLTARLFRAEEALKVGFVSAVHSSREATIEAAMETAKMIAGKSPVAVQGTKFLLDYSRDRPVEDGLHMTAVWNSGMLQTKDVTSAMTSGLTKRKPTFEKL
ncbi:hypothetical protein MRB53_040603 [Persea americana]|nr:hypothetical protein MRB53_040603 [Persea americana]